MSALPKLSGDGVLARRQSLIDDGYRPVPCKGKYPANFEGWSQCHATAENVRAWEVTHPQNRNTGILCGDVVAIDVDILRQDLIDAIGNMVRELPGGENAPARIGMPPKSMFFFRTTEPREKDATDWFTIDGVDQRVEIMGIGQQVVVDGIHPDTKRPYEWQTPLPPFADLPLVHWPALETLKADVSALLAQHAETVKPAPKAKPKPANDNFSDNYFRRVNTAALDRLNDWVPALGLPKTRRHGESFRAVCQWRGVLNANLSFHPTGITDFGSGETHTAIDVAVRSGKADGVTSAAEWLCDRLGVTKQAMGWIEKDGPILPGVDAIAAMLLSKRKKQTPAHNPFGAEAAGGLMGDIAQWILATSRRKSPELAVMAAVAFLSAFYGRRVVTPTGCGVNLYLAGIAGPGYGKEAPLQRLTSALQESGMAYLVGAGEVSSSSAIEKILRRKPVVVMPWDEMGDILEQANAKGSGNWAATIRSAMLQLYSKSTGVWFGKETTDEERLGEPIYCPSLSIVGTSTPTRFYGGLSEKNLSDGFVARLIIVAPNGRPERSWPRDNGLKVPTALLARIKKDQDDFPWPKRMGGADNQWRTAGSKPSLVDVPWADNAADMAWRKVEDWQDDEIDRDESRDGIVGRAAENAIRLATLRALSRGPTDAKVTVEDVAWARALVMSSIEAVDAGVDKYMTTSRFEELCKAIMAALRVSKGGTLYRAELLKRRGVRGSDDRTFNDALKRLQETGDIERTDGKKLTLAS